MFYDRKIKYFNYWERGEKLRGAGFVKLEVRDKCCNLTLQISGLSIADKVSRMVYLSSGADKAELCEVSFEQGKAGKTLQLNCDNLCGGITYEKLEGVWIPISADKELICIVAENIAESESVQVKPEGETGEEEKLRKEEKEEDEYKAVERKVEKVRVAERKVEKVKTAEGKVKVAEGKVKAAEGKVKAAERKVEKVKTTEGKVRAAEETEEKDKQIRKRDVISESPKEIQSQVHIPLLDNKWEQLSAIYPHIKPFRDDREYLSIGPSDFVILPQKYYKLVNNSFLLHGYYNYKHLILTRVERRSEVFYYIGVPGNFYEREKQVAIMFGFESFECTEEPAQDGDYGYYMIQVEL